MSVGKLIEGVIEPAIFLSLLTGLCYVSGLSFYDAYYEDLGVPQGEIALSATDYIQLGFWLMILVGLAAVAVAFAAFAYALGYPALMSPWMRWLTRRGKTPFDADAFMAHNRALMREHIPTVTLLLLAYPFFGIAAEEEGIRMLRGTLMSAAAIGCLVAFTAYAGWLLMKERIGVLTKLRTGNPGAQVAIAVLLVGTMSLLSSFAGSAAVDLRLDQERVVLAQEGQEENATYLLVAHHDGKYYLKYQSWCPDLLVVREEQVRELRYVESGDFFDCDGSRV